MRLALDDIGPRGRTVKLDPNDPEIVAAVGQALDGEVRSLAAQLSVTRQRRRVSVEGTGHATVERACDRCGAPVTVEVAADEQLTYVAPHEEARTGEVELSADDLDVGFHTGEALDLLDVFSELFALGAPLRVTCGGAACLEVVQALDSGDSDVAGHPAFAALKDLF